MQIERLEPAPGETREMKPEQSAGTREEQSFHSAIISRSTRDTRRAYTGRVRYAFICIALGVTLARAENTTNYYIERYPGDGMKMRPRPARSNESIISRDGLPEVGASSTNLVVGTNGQTRAARYISPRVGSKEFAPSRLPEPKVQTVVAPIRDKKLPPPPKISEKANLNALPNATPSPSSTNAPAAAVNQPQ